MFSDKSQKQTGFIAGLEGLAMIAGLLASIVLLSLNSARAKSRDAKRLADIRQIAAALELYRNDHDGYPGALTETAPLYIIQIPTQPLPPDGSCTPEQNQYVYKKLEKYKFKVNFCLGNATGGYQAGVRTLTEKGVD